MARSAQGAAGAVAGPAAGDVAVDRDGDGAITPAEDGRSARKRRAIIEAATMLFLQQGYQGTNMDDIAAHAAVSKQTVYKNFADKQRLFAAVVLGTTRTAEEFASGIALLLADTQDVQRDLSELARRYLTTVMQPRVLQLRRLVISEAGRFPELARSYYQQAPDRVLAALAASLEQLSQRGLLRVDDPAVAADHFAWLVLGPPLDRAMFCGDDKRLSTADLERAADTAVRVFLAAYSPR